VVPKLVRTVTQIKVAIMSYQGRSQDFSKGGAEVMEAKALKSKNCL